ncbi:MAG: methyl-accepting chemotaxis protein [Ruminobacter sp.]|nr:methyl-accepting chemotaxis protein [Ruminobacter sp.]
MNLLKSISVSSKFIGAFGFIILLTIIISYTALSNIKSSNEAATITNNYLNETYSIILNTNEKLARIRAIVFDIKDTPSHWNNETESELNKLFPEITTDISKNINDVVQGDSFKNYPKIIELFNELNASLQEIPASFNDNLKVALNKKESVVELNKIYSTTIYLKLGVSTDKSNVLTNTLIGAVNDKMATLKSSVPFFTVLILALISTLISVGVAFILYSTFVGILRKAVIKADQLASGDFSSAIQTHFEDEFGHMLNALENIRVRIKDEILDIRQTANETLEYISQIKETTVEINEGGKITGEQALSVATASEEMVATTNEIASNCEEAALASETSQNITQEGCAKVNNTINIIKTQVEKTKVDAQEVHALATQAEQISHIVRTIADIAAQTNLLALNAAIEAARAGQFGRGFAVVADEVRALASRTSDSTTEISNMVSEIQKNANKANASMQSSVANMDSLETETVLVEELLNNITNQVHMVNGQISQIATAAEQQNATSGEISNNIQKISTATSSLNCLVNSVRTDVELAVEKIDHLNRSLDFFKV